MTIATVDAHSPDHVCRGVLNQVIAKANTTYSTTLATIAAFAPDYAFRNALAAVCAVLNANGGSVGTVSPHVATFTARKVLAACVTRANAL